MPTQDSGLLDPDAVQGADWVCAHLFYDTDQDLLLTDCVRPLVAELTAQGLVQRYFFLRYWEGGPHVRLRLLPARAADRAAVEGRAARHLRDFLARTPAADVVDRGRFAEVAAGLAGLEGRLGHDAVVRPNNSVEFPAYEREHADYGYGAAIGAVERHFFESSRLALSVVAAGVTVEQRALLAFDLVVGVFALCDEVRDQWVRHGGPPLPFGSGPEAADVAPRHLAQRDRLRERARRTWRAARAPEAGRSDQRAYWLASVRRLRERLHALEETGAFAAEWAASPLAEPLGLSATRHPATSLVLLRCAHLVNNRLGLTLWQENQLRFLVGRVLAELPEALTAS
ncbi:lantibiotic dehydratase C-terminal domain-containing protein [Streptomyces sp. NPDC093097]|uniref:lantibiotic dehydratase C-terminal domain-containing protein n=1 Tax=Streptomyces sp. NPDC093097 TaxID=3366027 RepID=UPI00381544BB